MRGPRSQADINLEDLDWKTDPAYTELAEKREAMARRQRELPDAIAAAEFQAQDATERHEEQTLLSMINRGDARLQAQTKARVEASTDAVRRLKAERLLVEEELPKHTRAAAIVAREARQRTAARLQALYVEAAAELAEVLPRVIAIQARLAAIHRKAGFLFPPTIGRPRPEADDGLPSYAGLPNLTMPELVHHPSSDRGGKIGRLEHQLARYLEDHGGGVAVAE